MVYVEKGGEIIPKITGVDKDARSFMLGEKVDESAPVPLEIYRQLPTWEILL